MREGKCFAKGDPIHRGPSSLGSLLARVPHAPGRTWLLHRGEEAVADFSSMPVFFVPHGRSRSRVRPTGPGDRNLQYRSLTSEGTLGRLLISCPSTFSPPKFEHYSIYFPALGVTLEGDCRARGQLSGLCCSSDSQQHRQPRGSSRDRISDR